MFRTRHTLQLIVAGVSLALSTVAALARRKRVLHRSGLLRKSALTLGIVIALLGVPASPAFAKNLLVYGPSLYDRISIVTEKTLAEAAGHTVTVVDTATWSSMSTADFQAYDAIVFGEFREEWWWRGDTMAAANANKEVWSAAVTGPIVMHSVHALYSVEPGGYRLVANAINYAASGPGTGLYVDESESMEWGEVPYLSAIGSFSVHGFHLPCGHSVHIVDPCHPVVNRVTDACENGLSNWYTCSTIATILGFPASLEQVAVVTDDPEGTQACIVATPAPAPPGGDTTAPTTTAALSGTLGSGGWYRSAVTVTLCATDPDSNVHSTSYRVDGGTTQTYAGPFTVSGDGGHTVKFWSVDCSGNTEVAASHSFGIDTRSPAVSESASLARLRGKPVATVSGKIGDALSGLDPSTATYAVSDQYGQITPGGPLTLDGDGTYSLTITLGRPTRGDQERTFEITIHASDLAGNAGSGTVLLVVTHANP